MPGLPVMNCFRGSDHRSPAGVVGPLLVVLVALAGCAGTPERRAPPAQEAAGSPDIEPTVVAYRDYRDPLIRLNRAIFAFNDVSYRYVLIPLGKGYMKAPAPVRKSAGNFFDNLRAPIYLINNLLQLKPGAAARNVARFGVNTTAGVLGLFDPATRYLEIEQAPASFGDTLAHYGAGYGVYLVVPLLGPSDLRNGSSALLEGFVHPISYLTRDGERILIQSFDYFQDFAPEAERYETLEAEAEDPYVFFRNLYLQGVQRDAAYEKESE